MYAATLRLTISLQQIPFCFPGISLRGVCGLASISTKQNVENSADADFFSNSRNKELNKIFSDISSGGCFAVGGVANLPCLPGLKIQGIGDISLPLSLAQADLIKAVGTQAPYGKGAETFVDKAVRNTIQVSPSLVTFSPRWASILDELARTACDGMGLHLGKVRAELYKLLLYQEGGHFKPHQDTEKSVGMFGTLVVQFPSSFAGGTCVVRHNGLQRTFRMGADDGSCSTEYHHVAHFADCEHEVEEITAGNRLVAVYSLIWADDSPLPSAPDMEATSRLAAFLEQNMHNRTLGYLLTHEYTQQSLSNFGFRALKRRDRTIAGALLAASAMMRAGSPGNELVINVARMSQSNIEERNFNPEIEFEEVFHSDGKYWQPGPGKKHHLGQVEFSRDMVNFNPAEKTLWGAGEFDSSCWFFHHEVGYLGNEGYEDESIYSRYVLTFCRREAVDAYQSYRTEYSEEEKLDGEEEKIRDIADIAASLTESQ